MNDPIEDFTLVLDPTVDEALASVNLSLFLCYPVDTPI